jgi:hypothetical protein
MKWSRSAAIPNLTVTHYTSFMDFSVVTSEKDGAYDPVAQYKWNQDHGFISHEYALLLNRSDETYIAKQNFQVQECINNLRIALLDLIEDEESENYWNKFTNACETAGEILAKTPIFTNDSSNSIMSVIDALIKLELFGEDIKQSDYRNYIWDACLDKVITSPACPRPVLWQIIDQNSSGKGFDLYGPNSSTNGGVYFALCKNPVLGDTLLSKVSWVLYEGNFNCMLNPSLTIKSLEKLSPAFAFYGLPMDQPVESFIKKFLRNMPLDLINLPADIMDHRDLNLNLELYDISVGEYLILASRLIMEIKLGRSKMKELKDSKIGYVLAIPQIVEILQISKGE